MSAHVAKSANCLTRVGILIVLEREAVKLIDTSFPNSHVFLHFLDLKRGMIGVIHKKANRFKSLRLNISG